MTYEIPILPTTEKHSTPKSPLLLFFATVKEVTRLYTFETGRKMSSK